MRKFLIILFLEGILFVFPGIIYASDIFENASVASLGLGNTLYPFNPSCAFYNPASLMYVEKNQFVGSYYLLFNGARYNLLGFKQYIDKFAWSVQGIQLYRDGIEVRTSLTETPDYLTYCSKTGALLTLAGLVDISGLKNIMLGSSLKLLYYDIAQTQSGLAVGVDLGLYKKEIFKTSSASGKKFSVDCGLSITNIGGLNLQMGENIEIYPAGIRGSLILNYTIFPRYNQKKEKIDYDEISMFCDFIGGKKSDTLFGIQYKLIEMLKLRIGYNRGGTTGGFSWEFENVGLNYALSIKEYTQLHFLDLVYNF